MENERAFEIIVNVQGDVFYQGKPMSGWELQNTTLHEFTRFPHTVFFIKGDENTDYEKIDAVLGILKKNHIQNVVIMAERARNKNE